MVAAPFERETIEVLGDRAAFRRVVRERIRRGRDLAAQAEGICAYAPEDCPDSVGGMIEGAVRKNLTIVEVATPYERECLRFVAGVRALLVRHLGAGARQVMPIELPPTLSGFHIRVRAAARLVQNYVDCLELVLPLLPE